MYRALAWKELRETWWMGVAGCLCVTAAIWDDRGLWFDLETFRISIWNRGRLPFSGDGLTTAFVTTAAVLGALLGFWQTLFESASGTWPFLMHRPLTHRGMLLAKLGTGAVLIGLATGLPLLLYVLWLDTIGSRTQPFRWWMTSETWVLWIAALGVYLAAFLCGLRATRWHVSRLWPLVPAVSLPVFLLTLSQFVGLGWCLVAVVLLNAVLLGAIAHAALERDYA